MALFAAPALAQELDCNNALTQSDMTQCAYQGWQYADGDLNATYRLAVSWAKETDASLPGSQGVRLQPESHGGAVKRVFLTPPAPSAWKT
ncbi:MAG: hypothetical protein P8X43_08020 [Maritimibacter sp.]